MPTLREYQQKLTLLEQLQEEVKRLESDPDFQADLEFRKEIQAIKEKYGKTDQEVLDIINPPAVSAPSLGRQKRGPAKGRKTSMKVWRNPNTGEQVQAKNMLNKRLQEWIEEYGREEVRRWVVQEEDAG